MASSNDVTLPATKRSRKSIGAHLDISRVTMDKENATIDIATTLAASRRKARSKSIGPGGIDSLRQGHGNRRASLAAPPNPPRSILKPTIAPLPEIPPLKKNSRQALSAAGSANARGNGASAPDLGGSKIALKTEEEQQAAAREREERERRDARRKSLANRRVSFAAEATLHTFHEIEEMNDAASKLQGSETPSDTQAAKRRSSLASLSNFNNAEDDTVISMYSSDSEPADAVEEIPADEEEEEEEEDSNSDLDDGTMVSVVTEENTGTTIEFDDSSDEVDDAEETSTLDEALRTAARRAATHQNNEDSDDGEEIIPSFGWAKKPRQSTTGPIKQAATLPDPEQDEREDDEDPDMDMDMDKKTSRK
ncbi:hypothetical protein ESCO_000344 [Escovopsis weberi]|uniref:Uncharacterized protein n=1 Tax=Escovopsis weberi TaxID=150374 RepID=A0A0M9VUH2_ESCWE|nr:hypothetical protein ESCO_000344 [Escovopsis weberi]